MRANRTITRQNWVQIEERRALRVAGLGAAFAVVASGITATGTVSHTPGVSATSLLLQDGVRLAAHSLQTIAL